MSISRRSHAKRRLDVHICELSKTSESNLPKLPPNARFYSRWRRNFQKLFLVSVNHPLTRDYLRSYATIAFEKRRHGRSTFWWIIHPCSELRYYWDLIMTFTYLYMLVASPYIMAFRRVAKNTGVESWEPVYPAFIISIIDIVLNFITGFKSREGHEIFLNPFMIIRHYLRGYFLIDFLSSVPYFWFYPYRILPSGPDSNSIFLVPEFLLSLKILRTYTLRFYTGQLFANFNLSHAQDKALWLGLLTILIFHWFSCLTHVFPFILAHLEGLTAEDSKMYFYAENLYKRSETLIYLTYFHLGVSNFFGSAFSELRNLKKSDMIIRCILLLFGKGFTVYLIVIVLQLHQSATEPELKYQRIMHRVREYMRDKKLPENLRNKLRTYYEYRFQGSYFKENAIYGTLSSHLNQEIMIHSSRLTETSTILHSLPRNVLSNLMGVLKPVIYLNEDVIYKSDTLGDSMFFIVSGTVTLITFNGREICHEKDGGYFGEAALIYPEKRRLETVITLEVCELLRFNRRDFKRMFTQKSTFYTRLEKVAKERYDQINEILESEIKRVRNKEGYDTVNVTDEKEKYEKEYKRTATGQTDGPSSDKSDERKGRVRRRDTRRSDSRRSDSRHSDSRRSDSRRDDSRRSDSRRDDSRRSDSRRDDSRRGDARPDHIPGTYEYDDFENGNGYREDKEDRED